MRNTQNKKYRFVEADLPVIWFQVPLKKAMRETPAGGGTPTAPPTGAPQRAGGKVPPMAELAVESCRVTQTTIYSYHSTQTTIYRYQSTQTTASICPTWLTVHNCPKAGMTASLAFPGGLGPGHHVVQPRRSGAKFSTAKQDLRPFPGGFGSWASRCPAPPERGKGLPPVPAQTGGGSANGRQSGCRGKVGAPYGPCFPHRMSNVDNRYSYS